MPHSGGGGSHSGGSHGGGGSGGSSRPAMSNRPYKGCHSYVYYYNDRPHVYYADRLYDPKSQALWTIIKGIIMALFILISFGSGSTICKGKLPLTYEHSIYIKDRVGLVEDTDALKEYLEDFRDRSGIAVAVIIDTPDSAPLGQSCELQSYNRYVELWDDESHWLIYYVGEAQNRSDDWEWNLMCGNDCLKVLPSDQEDLFTDEFHRRLVASQRYTFDEAVIEALSSLTIHTEMRLATKGSYRTVDLLFIGIFMFIPTVIILIGVFKYLHPSKKALAQMEASEFKGEKQEYKCTYCDRIYIRNQTYSCPYCGGPAE